MSSAPYPEIVPHQMDDDPSTLLTRPQHSHLPDLIDIPKTPLAPEGQHLGARLIRLEIESDTCLKLQPIPRRPPWFSRTLYLVLIACLLFMLYYSAQGISLALERNHQMTLRLWVGVAAIPAVILLGVLIYPFFRLGPLLFRFDRHTHLMIIERRVGMLRKTRLVATYSLAEVFALQLLYRYFQAFEAGLHPPGEKIPSYEMNLVMRNPVSPRINLAVHSDWQWMRQAGPRLAEFLEVPVVDQLCQS